MVNFDYNVTNGYLAQPAQPIGTKTKGKDGGDKKIKISQIFRKIVSKLLSTFAIISGKVQDFAMRFFHSTPLNVKEKFENPDFKSTKSDAGSSLDLPEELSTSKKVDSELINGMMNSLESIAEKGVFQWKTKRNQEVENGKQDHFVEDIRKKMERKYVQAYPFLQKGKSIKWVTGNRSPALIGIDRVKNTCLAKGRHALIPTGELIKHNLVPLTGEMAMGLGGVNESKLSGTIFYHLEGAYQYANKDQFIATPENELGQLKYYNEHFDNFPKSTGGFNKILMSRMRIAVLRIIQLDSSKEIIEQAKGCIQDMLDKTKKSLTLDGAGKIDNKMIKDFEEQLSLFKTEKTLSLSEEEKGFFSDSFPILWGTTQDLGSRKSRVRSDIKGEVGIEGSLAIGEEIDVVFTKKNKIKTMRKWLDDRGLTNVSVMSFGAAKFLAMKQAYETSF